MGVVQIFMSIILDTDEIWSGWINLLTSRVISHRDLVINNSPQILFLTTFWYIKKLFFPLPLFLKPCIYKLKASSKTTTYYLIFAFTSCKSNFYFSLISYLYISIFDRFNGLLPNSHAIRNFFCGVLFANKVKTARSNDRHNKIPNLFHSQVFLSTKTNLIEFMHYFM